MDREEFLRILKKYETGTITAEEREFLYAYYQLFELHEDVIERMDGVKKVQLKQEIKHRIDQGRIHADGPQDTIQDFRPRRSINWFWMAASVIGIVGLGFIGYMWKDWQQNGSSPSTLVSSPKDTLIRPGKDDAILTLADGEQISLTQWNERVVTDRGGIRIEKSDQGELVYRVQQSSAVQENKVETPRGGQYRIILADGSKVWLNASSSIRFPTAFVGDERKVELNGEAYFEVKKGDKPFRVVSDNQVVEVLGTAFNVNTYKEEGISKTTLIEGSVSVRKKERLDTQQALGERILKPGQQAWLFASNNTIAVEEVDVDVATAWKEGYFRFDRTDLQSIMRQVARWYDVEVEYRGELSKDLFVGAIDRSEDIEEVLKVLKRGKINVEIVGRKLIVTQ